MSCKYTVGFRIFSTVSTRYSWNFVELFRHIVLFQRKIISEPSVWRLFFVKSAQKYERNFISVFWRFNRANTCKNVEFVVYYWWGKRVKFSLKWVKYHKKHWFSTFSTSPTRFFITGKIYFIYGKAVWGRRQDTFTGDYSFGKGEQECTASSSTP